MRTVLGKVGMTPKGVYNNTTKYVRLDVVTKDGQSYVCIKDCNGINVTNTTYWQLIASKGEMPINGIDYNTEEDKQVFKEAVVEDSKTEMDNYTTEKKTELDEYKTTKEKELDAHKTTLEKEMITTKDSLVQEIGNAQSGFDENATNTIKAFNDNATEQTNTFNTNAQKKTTDFDNNASAKTTDFDNNAQVKTDEYNNNHTTKLEEYNTNAINKVAEFNNNVDSIENELTELASQMPWNTTEIQDSIHIEDSAKYSRNKLYLFGNLVQEKRSGKNKLNSANLDIATKNGVTVTYDENDDSFTFNGTCTVDNTLFSYKNTSIDFTNNITKMIVFYEGGSITNVGEFRSYSSGFKNPTKVSLMYLSASNKIISNPTTETATKTIFDIKFNNGTVLTNFKIKLMITDSDDITYEKYGSMPSIDYPSMPVVATGVQKITKIGKNLLKFKNGRYNSNGIIADVIDGKIILNGTATDVSFVQIPFIHKFNNDVVSLSANNDSTVGDEFENYAAIRIMGDIYTMAKFYSKNGKKTFVLNGEIRNITIRTAKGLTYNNFVLYPQLEFGQPTDYEPYTEEIINLDLGNTELCKITDENGNIVAQDRVVYKDGKFQIEKKIEKIVLNGTENWGIQLRGTANWFYILSNIIDKKILTYDTGNKYAKCNYLKSNPIYTSNSNYGFFLTSSETSTFIRIRYGKEDTVENFKNLLSSNNMVIYCLLYEPEYIDCTPAQSETLEKLYKLSLQKGTNNIFVELENVVTTELQLTYMQDRIMLEESKNQEFDDRITAIEELLSTTQTSAMLLDNIQSDLESEV